MGSRNDGAFRPGRDGGLQAQIGSAVEEPPPGELEGCVAAQPVEVVGVLVAAGDRENPGAQNLGRTMGDAAGIAFVPRSPPPAVRQGRAAAPLATAA